MKLFLKILIFIFTMISTLGEIKSSTVAKILYEKALYYPSRFVGGFMMTGNLAAANRAGLNGALVGAPVGGISGSISAYRYAIDNNINPWNGKYNKPLYHYTTGQNADIIMNSHLGQTQDSWNYLTPDGTKTSLQAQIDLALPPNNTAESLIMVKPNSIYPKNIILQRNVTGNVYGRPGGGYEIIYKGTIPTKYLIRLK